MQNTFGDISELPLNGVTFLIIAIYIRLETFWELEGWGKVKSRTNVITSRENKHSLSLQRLGDALTTF